MINKKKMTSSDHRKWPPLKLQYQAGHKAFTQPKIKYVNEANVVAAQCPFPIGSMAEKEWQRGYNKAYFECQRLTGLEKPYEINARH